MHLSRDELLKGGWVEIKDGIFSRAVAVGGVGATVNREPPRALGRPAPPAHERPRSLPAGCELTVTLTALVARRMDPDNLATALKPIQDAIAEWLGIDDGDPRVRWEYAQAETRGAEGVIVRCST